MDIETVNNAIDYISSYRAYWGAQQNELEESITINELTAENLANAENNISSQELPAATVELSKEALLFKTNLTVARIAKDAAKSVLKLIGGYVDLKI